MKTKVIWKAWVWVLAAPLASFQSWASPILCIERGHSNCLSCLPTVLVWGPIGKTHAKVCGLTDKTREVFQSRDVPVQARAAQPRLSPLSLESPMLELSGAVYLSTWKLKQEIKGRLLWNYFWPWEQKITPYFPFGKELLASSFGISVSEG